MGTKLNITETEKLRIKLLYEVSDEKKEMDEIQSIELSDCDDLKQSWTKQTILLELPEQLTSFNDVVKKIKGGYGITPISDLLLFTIKLCFYIQIMKTSKRYGWDIPKYYFKTLYEYSSGIEYHFDSNKVPKVKQFLDEFRETYNSY